MSPTDRPPPAGRAARQGFSILEVSISMVIVAVVLVTALQSVGSTIRGQFLIAQSGRGSLLAQALLAEILQTHYQDPGDDPVFGPEPGEAASGTRADFNDVDDYHGWTASPPQQKDGTPLPDLDGWQRSVTVEYVDPDDLTMPITDDQGVKRITVQVSHHEIDLVSVATVVSRSWLHCPYRDVDLID